VKALQIYFKVPVEVRRDEGGFVASCFLLDDRFKGATKHDALMALTADVQELMTARCSARMLDALLRQYDLHVPDPNEELVSGHYIDVAVQLKIPGMNGN
jgi:hypothetical protein